MPKRIRFLPILPLLALAQPLRAQAPRNVPPFTPADVSFMTGMIAHHAQAILIAGWAPSHGASASVRVLCERIVVAQGDEITAIQRWLRERNLPVPSGDPHATHQMPGMSQPMAGASHDMMPGMLSPAQLDTLDAARGPDFDRAFLRYMIMHHQGALAMVDQLLESTGATQDGIIYRFATDVHADQSTEIERMQRMLAALPSGR